MGGTRKRTKKKSIVSGSSTAQTPSVSHKVTRSTITAFHVLLRKKANLTTKVQHAATDSERSLKQKELDVINNDISELGGLDAYQKASQLGQSKDRGGDSSRILVSWLLDMGIKKDRPLKMLEIGALRPDNYASERWLKNTPIDLHSQHPSILEQDFFLRPLPRSEEESFDLISCSLVLNFVDDPARRGKMLQLIHEHLKPNSESLLFLVLPLPCVNNSRYLTLPVLVEIMEAIGFILVKERWKTGGKVGYWLWRWKDKGGFGKELGLLQRKILQQSGAKMNNFAIVLP
ncbi:nucleolar protein [Cryptococcus neoformans Tu401-1]|nr:nucleolar protein [Cryptococcus neoformans var. grubii Bt85]OXG15418.1 nucleolar protein [Cryptococcus neoformans var. grubii Tu401-1]OXM78054.1 nucleolar protein [Cryptococcus neoformans var. grubii Bt63]